MRALHRFGWLAAPLAVLVFVLAWRLGDPGGLLNRFRFAIFDYYQNLHPREPEATPVVIVDIDEASIGRVGQWPWPRNRLAELVDRLGQLGAAAVAFDIIFAEPDQTSPNRIVRNWPEPLRQRILQAAAGELADNDSVFAEALARVPTVMGFALDNANPGRLPLLRSRFARAGDDPEAFISAFDGAVTTLPHLESAAAGNGALNQIPEPDGISRRIPLLLRIGKEMYPGLAVEALRVAQGANTLVVKASGATQTANFGTNTGVVSLKIGQFVVPTDANAQMWLHFSRPFPERYVSAWRVFEGQVEPERLDGAIVLIGTSATGLKDLRTSPLDAVIPGIEIHAQALEQMILGHFLDRPDWSEGAELAFILIVGLAVIVLLRGTGPVWCAVVGLGAILGAVGFSWYSFVEHRHLIDAATPAIAAAMVYVAGSLVNFLRVEGERRHVRGAFAQYLSPTLVAQLASDPSRLRLGGERKDMTILFSDIRGFTTIAETFKGDPESLTRVINGFLTPMTDIIHEAGGTIDKYMGDAIMAFWNAPLDDPQHATHACRAALTMVRRLDDVNADLAEAAKAAGYEHRELKIGIGLNSGQVLVGNLGSQQRFDYSVLGDAVNLASRLEGQSKTYGVAVVIGEATRERAPEFAVLELDLIAVKGKKEAARIYTLLGDETRLATREFLEWHKAHDAMLALYRTQRWDEAERTIAECRRLGPELDGFYDLYAERIGYYRENPPGADWDGVYIALTK
jgi:adenylate cyclase